MSEGKWNHPMFEKIRNAEVEAPEFIMDAAIKRSSRNSFFYFQWHSLNVWYLALGLSIGLSVLFFNTKQKVSGGQLISKPQIEQAKSKVDVNRSSTMEATAVSSYAKHASSKGSATVEKGRIEKNTSTVESDASMNANAIGENTALSSQKNRQEVVAETQPDSIQHSLRIGSTGQEEGQTVQPHIDVPKRGRSLKVKIGENAKP